MLACPPWDHDPKFMGFGTLRVINEDRVQPGKGFATHGHQDMEIVSYVLSGALQHRDSLDGRDGSVTIHQDVDLFAALLVEGQRASHTLAAVRSAWIQVARGDVVVAGQRLGAGDGVAFDAAGVLSIEALAGAEILLFDMG